MSVLPLAAAKTHLNITTENAARDVELQAMIDAAEAVLGNYVGPLAPTQVTHRVLGGQSLFLPITPVASLVSVTPYNSAALTVGDLHLDTAAGIVSHPAGSRFGASYYDVVYMAGRATCPSDLLLAVKELVRHLWKTQRGATRRDDEAEDFPGSQHTLPWRVQELIEPHLQIGFA